MTLKFLNENYKVIFNFSHLLITEFWIDKLKGISNQTVIDALHLYTIPVQYPQPADCIVNEWEV